LYKGIYGFDNNGGKNKENQSVTIETLINKTIDEVWEKWTVPQHIMEWSHASDGWYTPSAENDLRVGGRFNSKMAARDGSYSSDFGGVYDEVIFNKKIAYTMDDGRKVVIEFAEMDEGIKVIQTFDAEEENSLEMQRAGWQSILDNFKRYVEIK